MNKPFFFANISACYGQTLTVTTMCTWFYFLSCSADGKLITSCAQDVRKRNRQHVSQDNVEKGSTVSLGDDWLK